MDSNTRRTIGLCGIVAAYLASRAFLLGQWTGPNAWMYGLFADAASCGRNPYLLPEGGSIGPELADYPPLWMVAFGALAQWMRSDYAVRIVCYAGDAVLMLAALRFARKRLTADAAATAALVALNPAWFWADMWMLQYKAWATAGLVFLATTESALVTGALAGAFLLPGVLLPMRWLKDRDWRALMGGTAVAVALWLPWFPSSIMGVLARRSAAPHNTGYWGESLGGYLPRAVQPFLLAVAVGLALVIMARGRAPLAVRFAGATKLVIACMHDAMVNRWLPFALVPLLTCELGARSRWVAFGLCCISCAATWNVLVFRADVPAIVGVLINAPLPLAAWAAYRNGQRRPCPVLLAQPSA
jgi:hypothetical protein